MTTGRINQVTVGRSHCSERRARPAAQKRFWAACTCTCTHPNNSQNTRDRTPVQSKAPKRKAADGTPRQGVLLTKVQRSKEKLLRWASSLRRSAF